MIDMNRLISEYGGSIKNGRWEIPYRRVQLNSDKEPYADCKGIVYYDSKDENCIWRNGSGRYLEGSGILFSERVSRYDDLYGVRIPGGVTYADMERFLIMSGVRKKSGAIYEQLTLF